MKCLHHPPDDKLAITGQAALSFDGYGLGWWIAEDFVADPGAYGAFPFIDNSRAYAAMVLLEVESSVGAKLALTIKPTLDAIIDGASQDTAP